MYMNFFNYTQTDKNFLDCFRLRLRNDVALYVFVIASRLRRSNPEIQ
jgi:hypothetical protein